MAKSTPLLYPKTKAILLELGENLKLARLRRKLTGEQVAERAGIGRSTLIKIEKGSASVAIGHYVNVIRVLGLEKDLLEVAKDDELGRKLQDLNLTPKKRGPKR